MGDEKPKAGKRTFRLESAEGKTGGDCESLRGRVGGIGKDAGDHAGAQRNFVQDEGKTVREPYRLFAFL